MSPAHSRPLRAWLCRRCWPPLTSLFWRLRLSAVQRERHGFCSRSSAHRRWLQVRPVPAALRTPGFVGSSYLAHFHYVVKRVDPFLAGLFAVLIDACLPWLKCRYFCRCTRTPHRRRGAPAGSGRCEERVPAPGCCGRERRSPRPVQLGVPDRQRGRAGSCCRWCAALLQHSWCSCACLTSDCSLSRLRSYRTESLAIVW